MQSSSKLGFFLKKFSGLWYQRYIFIHIIYYIASTEEGCIRKYVYTCMQRCRQEILSFCEINSHQNTGTFFPCSATSILVYTYIYTISLCMVVPDVYTCIVLIIQYIRNFMFLILNKFYDITGLDYTAIIIEFLAFTCTSIQIQLCIINNLRHNVNYCS